MNTLGRETRRIDSVEMHELVHVHLGLTVVHVGGRVGVHWEIDGVLRGHLAPARVVFVVFLLILCFTGRQRFRLHEDGLHERRITHRTDARGTDDGMLTLN